MTTRRGFLSGLIGLVAGLPLLRWFKPKQRDWWDNYQAYHFLPFKDVLDDEKGWEPLDGIPPWENYTSNWTEVDREELLKRISAARARMEFNPPSRLCPPIRSCPTIQQSARKFNWATSDGGKHDE